MDKFDRIFRLHAILASRRTPISLDELKEKLDCSKATVHRTINALKDYLGAPIVFDSERQGYRYTADARAPEFELPGLWFTPAELHALAIMQGLLQEAGRGLLEEHVGALTKRLNELTRHKRLNLSEAARRLKFPAIAARPAGAAFQIAISATLERRKLKMHYHARGTNERTFRTISPQRVIHYRESWYLDAWDEDKQALRSFSIDRILELTVLNEPATPIPEEELDKHYTSSYGIFSGPADKLAILHFSAERARWVADERWHPQQESAYLPDGIYELRIPYSDPRELIMDILRHGAHVKVVGPEPLRKEVSAQLAAASAHYPAGI
ncbi:MAG: YafY family transcriptional regulator [Sinobacteraceae bacterium]|nr:YafY family transcriptional regulator [Nevskiaceae bacterium]